MNITNDLDSIKSVLNISLEEIAQKINVSFKTVVSWHDGLNEISIENLNKLYNFAFRQNYRINEVKEMILKEEFENNDEVVLFHGSKFGLNKEICVENSKSNHDFGKGFYCGENFLQSACFVSNFVSSSIYTFSFHKSLDLKYIEFNVDTDWLILVSYFRGLIKEYEKHDRVLAALKKIEDVDYIIAPIADNRMFDLINNFIHKMITDVQCCHCISALNLGKQYVFHTNKAIKNLEHIDTLFLCENERKNYIKIRSEQMINCANKVDVAMIKYRGKGQYIDEVFA